MTASENQFNRIDDDDDDDDDDLPPYELPPPSYDDYCKAAAPIMVPIMAPIMAPIMTSELDSESDVESPAQRFTPKTTSDASDTSDSDDSYDSDDSECVERSDGYRCNRKRAIRHRALLMHYLNRLRISHARHPDVRTCTCSAHAYDNDEKPCSLTYYHNNDINRLLL